VPELEGQPLQYPDRAAEFVDSGMGTRPSMAGGMLESARGIQKVAV
jgi:hypothetical protein